MRHYQVWVNDWDLHDIIAESKEDAKRQVREWLGLERLRATVVEISPGYYDGIVKNNREIGIDISNW